MNSKRVAVLKQVALDHYNYGPLGGCRTVSNVLIVLWGRCTLKQLLPDPPSDHDDLMPHDVGTRNESSSTVHIFAQDSLCLIKGHRMAQNQPSEPPPN